MALPMAMSYMMPGIGGLIGTSATSNPMMRSAAEQALLGYGTAKLTGSKHPEKAAMYAGLGSMPFSFMKAQGAANMYNKQLAGAAVDPELFKTQPIMSKAVDPWWEYGGAGPGGLEQQLGIGSPGSSAIYHPKIPPKFTGSYQVPDQALVDKFLAQPKKITAWDVIGGRDYSSRGWDNLRGDKLADVVRPEMRDMKMIDMAEGPRRPKWDYYDDLGKPDMATLDAKTFSAPEVDFYSKVGQDQKNLLGQILPKGETFTDWTPTIASQTAGLYGGRATDEEKWEDAKARRRKELAFMYGIPEDMLGGEMENPYYGGGGFWKDGGIAALNMDAGGAVNGPGGPKDDVIDAKLSDGEFVMTAKAVENLGGGNRLAGAKQMYNMMNQLDPQSETVQESVIGVS